MRFVNLTDLVTDVKRKAPNTHDNLALQALRRSARKFMTVGELEEQEIVIDLVETQTVYPIPDLPAGTWVKDLDTDDTQYYDFTFNGFDSVTFNTVNYETGDTFTIQAILGYDADANDYPAEVVGRYFDGIIAGALADLVPSNSRYYNRNFHSALSEAMEDRGVFTGIEA